MNKKYLLLPLAFSILLVGCNDVKSDNKENVKDNINIESASDSINELKNKMNEDKVSVLINENYNNDLSYQTNIEYIMKEDSINEIKITEKEIYKDKEIDMIYYYNQDDKTYFRFSESEGLNSYKDIGNLNDITGIQPYITLLNYIKDDVKDLNTKNIKEKDKEYIIEDNNTQLILTSDYSIKSYSLDEKSEITINIISEDSIKPSQYQKGSDTNG